MNADLLFVIAMTIALPVIFFFVTKKMFFTPVDKLMDKFMITERWFKIARLFYFPFAKNLKELNDRNRERLQRERASDFKALWVLFCLAMLFSIYSAWKEVLR